MITFESTFPEDFRKDDIEQILRFVLTGKFCQLICLPGGGKATLLKLLAHNQKLRRFHLGEKEKSIRFTYINLLELTNLDQPIIDEFLLHSLDPQTQHSNDPFTLAKQLKDAVSKITGAQTLILLFDHFDEFQNKLSRSFFQTLRSLKNLARYKFTAIFATRRDLRELVDPEILKEFYDFFISNTVYMKLYDQAATASLLSQIEKNLGQKLSPQQKSKIVNLTSGHTKLTKVAAEVTLQENVPLELGILLTKPIIRATLFELWLFLTAEEQKALLDIVFNKPIENATALDNLLHFDLIKSTQQSNNLTIQPASQAKRGEQFSFTVPLFEEFVRNVIPTITQRKIFYDKNTQAIIKGTNVISDLLSPQEYRLLRFLIENQERVVERDQIIPAVWPDAKVQEGISEAAIDQMVFRLRKKIEDEPNNPKHITTIKGRGFRFRP